MLYWKHLHLFYFYFLSFPLSLQERLWVSTIELDLRARMGNYIPHKFLWPGGPRAFEVGSPSSAILTSDFFAREMQSQ